MNNEKIYAVYRLNTPCKKDEFVCYAATPYFTQLELENCLGKKAVVDIDEYIVDMDKNIQFYQEEYGCGFNKKNFDEDLFENLKDELEDYQEFKKEAEEAKNDGCKFAIVNIEYNVANWFFDENEKFDTILSPNTSDIYCIIEVDEN